MKILFVVGKLAFPFRTGPLKDVAGLIRYMSARHDCDVLAFSPVGAAAEDVSPDKVRVALQDVRSLEIMPPVSGLPLLAGKLLNLARLRPVGFAHWDDRRFRERLAALLACTRYDLAYLFWFPAVAQYLPLLKGIPSVLTLYDPHSRICREAARDEASPVRRALLRLGGLLYRRAEARLCPLADKVHTVAAEEIAHVKAIRGDIDIECIPIHIPEDCERYAIPAPRRTGRSIVLPRPYGSGLTWFFDRVHPLVLKRIPSLETTVIGQHKDSALDGILRDCAGVRHVGWVDDFYGELCHHDAVVLTDRTGTGMSTRALVAMALGRPTIGFPAAFRGIHAEDRVSCRIESEPGPFADAIVDVLTSPGVGESLGARALQVVLSRYTYAAVMSSFDALFAAAITKRSTILRPVR